jgi:hypothetical protein
MIVNGGKLANVNALRTTLASYYMILFTNNFSIVDGTVYSSLTIAAWTGYAPVNIGTVNAAAIVGVQAVTVAAAACVFTNTSGSTQTFYGWAVVDSLGSPTLLEATNLGLQTLLNTKSISFPYSYALQDISD